MRARGGGCPGGGRLRLPLPTSTSAPGLTSSCGRETDTAAMSFDLASRLPEEVTPVGCRSDFDDGFAGRISGVVRRALDAGLEASKANDWEAVKVHMLLVRATPLSHTSPRCTTFLTSLAFVFPVASAHPALDLSSRSGHCALASGLGAREPRRRGRGQSFSRPGKRHAPHTFHAACIR